MFIGFCKAKAERCGLRYPSCKPDHPLKQLPVERGTKMTTKLERTICAKSQ